MKGWLEPCPQSSSDMWLLRVRRPKFQIRPLVSRLLRACLRSSAVRLYSVAPSYRGGLDLAGGQSG